MDPLVSVVVPVFNGAAFLGEALTSIAHQTHTAMEVIVVDDGSSDDSLRIAQSYGARCLTQNNQGPAAARNLGIEHARGELISFLDADDQWHVDKTQRQVSRLRADPRLDVIFGATCNGSGRGDIPDSLPLTTPVLGAGLFRRTVFERVGFFNAKLRGGEFIEWLQRCRRVGLAIHQDSHVVLLRRVHQTNHSRRARTRRGILQALKQGLDARRASDP